jgi:general secretion pathway protein F
VKLEYRAYDANGRIVSGSIEGTSETDVVARLKYDGLFPFETCRASTTTLTTNWLTREIGNKGLGLSERARFSRILAALISAGVPLDRALRLMADPSHGKKISKVATEAAEGIASGHTLSSILARPIAGFAGHEIGQIASAEHTGNFVEVLSALSLTLDHQLELRSKLGSALVYPLLLLIMAIASLVLIATVLVPNLAPLFADSGTETPLAISFLISAVRIVTEHGLEIALALMSILALVVAFFTSAYGRRFWGNTLLRFRIARQLEAARLCKTLSALLAAGVPLQTAIRTTSEAVTNHSIKLQLLEAVEKVVGGLKLSKAVENLSVLDAPSRQLIAVGEETNQVESLLAHVAVTLEASATRRIERLMMLLTPLMTIALGLLVGGLIMSVMRAILSINELAR